MENKSKLVIIISVVAIISMVLASNDTLTVQNYSTGISVDTSTSIDELTKKNKEPWPNAQFTDTANKEIFTNDMYVVSWIEDEWSQKITMQCQFNYRPLWCSGLFAQESVSISRYHVSVDYVKPSGEKIKIIDTDTGVDNDGNMWDTDYVEMVTSRFPEESRHSSKGAHGGHRFPNMAYSKHDFVEGDPYEYWYDVAEEINAGSTYLKDWHELDTDTFEFYLKGKRVGALEANFYIEWCQRNNFEGWDYSGWSHLGKDSCYLASGGGDLNILNSGSKSSLPSERSMYTSDGDIIPGGYYTPFVFEEGSDIKIEVDTGYSGSASEDGYWELAMYNGRGQQVKKWQLNDNLRGHVVSYTVPSGAFIKGGGNEWRVVLRNTLFDQAETRVFVIDDFEKAPGEVSMEIEEVQYTEGDTIELTLSGTGNPEGAGDISYFVVIAKYGTPSSMNTIVHKHVNAVPIGNNQYEGNLEFNLPARPETKTNLYIRATAVDSDGRAGGGDEKNFYVEQDTQKVTDPITPPSPIESNDEALYAIVGLIIASVSIGGIAIYRKRGGDFSELKNLLNKRK